MCPRTRSSSCDYLLTLLFRENFQPTLAEVSLKLFSTLNLVQGDRERRNLRVGLRGHRDIVVSEMVKLARRLRPPDDEQQTPQPSQLSHLFEEWQPVHGKV